jgi:hypothetical protein
MYAIAVTFPSQMHHLRFTQVGHSELETFQVTTHHFPGG